jgi:hypothetical protein
LVTDPEEKDAALGALVEHFVPGRSADARPGDRRELAATAVLALPLEEVSAKVRTGDPKDEEEDYDLPVWAGILPLSLEPGPPIPDSRLKPGIPVPPYVTAWSRGRQALGSRLPGQPQPGQLRSQGLKLAASVPLTT